MNPAKQFWTLFKFQLIANPYVWFMTFNFLMPVFFISRSNQSLDFLIPVQNLFFVGFIGVLMIAPEILYSSAISQWPVFGSEFLLTRAVDRRVLVRAKNACFYLVVLLAPILLFFYAQGSPSLEVMSYSKVEQQQCLDAFPGSTVLKNQPGLDHMVLPAGNSIVAGWHVWETLLSAAVVQILVVLIYPFPYRKYLLWGIFGLMIALPLLGINSGYGAFAASERLFFIYLGHRADLWLATIVALVILQAWFERRFARLEVS